MKGVGRETSWVGEGNILRDLVATFEAETSFFVPEPSV